MNEEEAGYFDRLIARYAQAVVVEPLAFAGAEPAKCHGNAARFEATNPGYSVVRGWLIAGLAGFAQYLIHAHAVVRRDDDGALFDVTPIRESEWRMHRFLEHQGTNAEFDILRDRFAQLYYSPLAAPGN